MARRVDAVEPLTELVVVEATGAVVVAQQRGHPVSIRVRRPDFHPRSMPTV